MQLINDYLERILENNRYLPAPEVVDVSSCIAKPFSTIPCNCFFAVVQHARLVCGELSSSSMPYSGASFSLFDDSDGSSMADSDVLKFREMK